MSVHLTLFTRRVVRQTAAVIALSAMAAGHPAAQSKPPKAPETFNARASVGSQEGRGDAYVTIRVERYTAAKDIDLMEKALKEGGSAGFVLALRRAPIVGHLEVGNK